MKHPTNCNHCFQVTKLSNGQDISIKTQQQIKEFKNEIIQLQELELGL